MVVWLRALASNAGRDRNSLILVGQPLPSGVDRRNGRKKWKGNYLRQEAASSNKA